MLSPLFSVCYSESVSFLVASAAPIFQSTPSDQTVVEGGDASFSCDATLNDTGRPLRYGISNEAGLLLGSVRRNGTNLSMVNGVVGAYVLGEFNSQLVLMGVTREANGYNVACSILNEDETLFIDQSQPPATISVIGTLLGILSLSMLLVCESPSTNAVGYLYMLLSCSPSCLQPPPKPTHHCAGRRRLHLHLWV